MTLTSSNLQVAFTRTMVPGRSRRLSCSRKHTRSAALLEGAHTKIRLSGKAWYTFIRAQETQGASQPWESSEQTPHAVRAGGGLCAPGLNPRPARLQEAAGPSHAR